MSEAPTIRTNTFASAGYDIADGDGFGSQPLARDGSREGGGATTAPRYSRRLSDKILIAFHHACDQADFDVADQLLSVLEDMLTRRPLVQDGNRRRSMETLVAAHERLWHLRHRTDTTN